jgi:hypothetical protein
MAMLVRGLCGYHPCAGVLRQTPVFPRVLDKHLGKSLEKYLDLTNYLDVRLTWPVLILQKDIILGAALHRPHIR